jgi:tetratricopeptide (TPR) repeat protein
VKRYPTFLRAWVDLGVLYYTAEKFTDAIPCFAQAVSLGDRDPNTFGLLGYSLEKMGNVVPAEMAYMQALAADPTNGDWMEGLLRIYIQGRQVERAESLVKNLIKARPTEARFWLTYANILIVDHRKLEAIALLETAAGTGVAGVDELNLLADLYAEQKLIPEAVAIYQKILVPAPELGERKLLRLAEALATDHQLQQAQDVLTKLPASLSAESEINSLQIKADILAAQKKWADARTHLQKLLQLAPLNGKALLSLGRTYAAEDDLPRASFAFEGALQSPDFTYAASLELANIELKNRHYDKSVEYLEKALKIERTSAVEDYLARIRPLVVKKSE